MPLLLRRRPPRCPRRSGQDPPSRHPGRTPPPPPASEALRAHPALLHDPRPPPPPVPAALREHPAMNRPHSPSSPPRSLLPARRPPPSLFPQAVRCRPASAAQQEAARGPQQQTGDYSYPDDDWGPPLDEDAPPLDEEPPMDWEPSRQWQGSPAPSSAPEIKAPAVNQPAESAPRAAQTRAKATAPAQADRQPAPDTSADPWSRAVEQTPGVWALGSESNVGKNPAAADMDHDEEPSGSSAPVYPPAAAQLPRAGGDSGGSQLSSTPGGGAPGAGAAGMSGPGVSGPAAIAAAESAPETAERGVPEFEPAYAMASAPAAASHEYGAPTPNQGVRAPAVTATDAAPVRVPVFASGPAAPAAPARCRLARQDPQFRPDQRSRPAPQLPLPAPLHRRRSLQPRLPQGAS